jgi:ABC-type transport system substrate-binding protein
MDKGKRLTLIHNIIQIIMEDRPIIPSLVRMTNTVANKKVKNFYIYPDDRIDLLNVSLE